MDVNAVTLKYLMNPQHYDRHMLGHPPNGIKTDKLKSEKLSFYKKRIIALTKDMLKDRFPEDSLRQSFNQYTDTLIEYFEFIDKNVIGCLFVRLERDNQQRIRFKALLDIGAKPAKRNFLLQVNQNLAARIARKSGFAMS